MGLLVLAVLLPVGMRPSEATFVAASANPGAQFAAAADFNTVAVVLTDPGSPLRGSVPVTATAASDRGITSVVFSTAPAGTGTWTVACTKTVAPYTCTFDTTTVADGLRDVRAVATDSAGYTRTSTVTNRRVDNTAPTATTTDPGSPLTGTVTVAGTAADGGSGLAERRPRVQVDAPAPGRQSARRRPRRSPAPGTPPRSPTASTTCARSPPTSPATRRSPPRSTTAASTTRRRPSR